MSSNVTVTISGRRYTIACAEGEQSHIEMLGAAIDSKLASLPGMSNQSESRSLLFAALLLADELHELQGKAPTASPSGDDAERLEKMAEKLETLASQLERAGTTS